MNVSAASLYQIDERGLELRRAYMGVTAAELQLLGGMQAWADRNADAIGAKLAEHTFSGAASGKFLEDYANSKGIRIADLKKGWGCAQAGHFKAIFSEAAKPGGFGVSYFEGLLGVGALHSRINLPLKWFLGTYPVFVDLVHEAMLADTPEPARVSKRRLRPQLGERRPRGHQRRRARHQPHLQLRLAGDRRGLLLRHVHVDGREPARPWARPARAATSPTCSPSCATTMHETRQELRRRPRSTCRRCARA